MYFFIWVLDVGKLEEKNKTKFGRKENQKWTRRLNRWRNKRIWKVRECWCQFDGTVDTFIHSFLFCSFAKKRHEFTIFGYGFCFCYGPLHMQISRPIKRSRKRKFVPGVWTSLTDIHLNGDDTYDPRRGTACRSKPANFRCTDRGCREILKRECIPYRQGVVEICHTSREQTWCPVSNSIEFLPITILFSTNEFRNF